MIKFCFVFGFFIDVSGGLLLDPLATGRPGSETPILLEEPEDAFVVKSKAATLSCRTAHALQLYFTCNGEDMSAKHHSAHEFVDPMTGIRQLEVKVDVTRNDVEEYFGLDGYTCECVAWSSYGQVKSRKARVTVACKYPSVSDFLYYNKCNSTTKGKFAPLFILACCKRREHDRID